MTRFVTDYFSKVHQNDSILYYWWRNLNAVVEDMAALTWVRPSSLRILFPVLAPHDLETVLCDCRPVSFVSASKSRVTNLEVFFREMFESVSAAIFHFKNEPLLRHVR